MSKALQYFLAKLATDPGTFQEYLRNPDEVMKEAGLSDPDRAALRSSNPAAIVARLDADEPAAAAGEDANPPAPSATVIVPALTIQPSSPTSLTITVSIVEVPASQPASKVTAPDRGGPTHPQPSSPLADHTPVPTGEVPMKSQTLGGHTIVPTPPPVTYTPIYPPERGGEHRPGAPKAPHGKDEHGTTPPRGVSR